MINHDNYDEVLTILENTLQDVVNATEVPACNEVQCGWAANHSLEGAKELAAEMLENETNGQRFIKKTKFKIPRDSPFKGCLYFLIIAKIEKHCPFILLKFSFSRLFVIIMQEKIRS